MVVVGVNVSILMGAPPYTNEISSSNINIANHYTVNINAFRAFGGLYKKKFAFIYKKNICCCFVKIVNSILKPQSPNECKK